MKPDRIRADAATVLASLLHQQGSLASLLPRPETLAGSDDGMALLRELCFGTCRWFHSLDFYLRQLIDKPLKRKDADIHCLLLIGMYQLQYLRLPDYAAINETVNAASVLKKVWAKNLVNAVLRQFQRQLAAQSLPAQPDAAAAGYPQWLYNAIRTAWPDQCPGVFEHSNSHPPMTLRVNQARVSREDYLQLLKDRDIQFTIAKLASSAIYLNQAMPVSALPGFAEGLISVQDEASQLIPGLLALQPGLRLLDACAAPGGKTCHILEQQPGLRQLTALDIESRRLQRLEQNLNRLGLRETAVQVKIADATDTASWWDRVPLDRILLDAPCSATGIIRRQPDIKVLRRSEDIGRLTTLQAKLLDTLWTTLAPGGLLLYTTCSVLPQENSDQVAAFLMRTADAAELPIGNPFADCGAVSAHGKQLLATQGGPDGFYYALLQKAA
jgi:16S rRNA (cytosine967-C5)-methyltransferase